MKVISFYNIKGGVAKTTSALSFALILKSKYRKRVLLIDADKQANSTKALGCYNPNDLSIANLLTNKDIIIDKVIKKSVYGIDVIPANLELIRANKEVLIDTVYPQQLRLKRQLEPVWNDYDYCIIDCPPDETMSARNALAVTNDVLIPIKMDNYSLDGMEYVVEAIESIKYFNRKIQIKGCFVTMFVKSNLYKDGLKLLSDSLGKQFMKTYIRQTVKVGESTFEKPLVLYSRKCTATLDYYKLVEEYLSLK